MLRNDRSYLPLDMNSNVVLSIDDAEIFFKENNIPAQANYPHRLPSYYPQPEGITAFKEKLSGYKTSKGTVQFLLNKPLPIDLILE